MAPKIPGKRKELTEEKKVQGAPTETGKAPTETGKARAKVDEKTRMRELREKRKAQKTLLCSFILKNLETIGKATDLDPEALEGIKTAATELKPGFSTVPTNRGVNARITSLFADKDAGFTISEDDVFMTVIDGTKLRAGRPEMRKFMKHAIQDVDADKRLWVRFDGPTETYQLKSKGANAPEDWKGFRPTAAVNVPG